MKQSVFVVLLVLILLPVVVLPILSAPSGVVMVATIAAPNEPYIQGSIRIPTAGVDASLSLAHVDDDCCYMGLWNGGCIIGDAQMFETVKVDDWADIVTEEAHIVAECVDISYAVEGFIHPNGDVLVCVRTAFPLVMRVYRFIVL